MSAKEPLRQLAARYRLLILAGMVGSLIVAVLLSVYQYRRERHDQLDLVRLNVIARVGELDSAVRASTDRVGEIRNAVETALAGPLPPPRSPLFAMLQDDPGGYFSLDRLGPPGGRRTLGNLYGLGSVANRSAEFYEDLDVMLWLASFQPALFTASPHVAWLYYHSRQLIGATYPALLTSDLGPGFAEVFREQFSRDYWIAALPENNPDRDPVWTRAYIDDAGKGLMVTYAEPVYRGNEFRGIAAADLTLAFLRQSVRHLGYPQERMMIVDRSRWLLAESWGRDTGESAPRSLADALPEGLSPEAVLAPGGGVAFRTVGRYNVLAVPLASAPWVLLYLFPESDLIAQAVPRFAASLALIVLVFGVLTAVYGLVSRRFVAPAIALARHIGVEAQGGETQGGAGAQGRAAVPARLPAAWQAWFAMVSSAFAANRALLARVISDSENLNRLVEERTQELICLNDALRVEIARHARVQDELRDERNFITTVLDTVAALVVVLDTEGRIVRFNRSCERLTGYASREVEGRLFWEFLLLPEEAAPIRAGFRALVQGGAPTSHENSWVSRNGERRLIAWSTTAMADRAGRIEFIVATGLDLTERRAMEDALRDTEERFQLAVRASDDGIWDWNLKTGTIWFSPRWKEQFGYADDELENKMDTWAGLVFGEDRIAALRLVDDYNAGRVNRFDMVQRFRHKDGHTVYIHSRAIHQKDTEGRAVRMVGAHTDITARYLAEDALRASETRFRDMATNVPGVIYQWYERRDGARGYHYVSPRCADIYGVSPEALMADWTALPVHPEDIARWAESVARAVERRADWSFEGRFILPDGRERWWRGVSRPTLSSDDEIVFDGVIIDIQEQKEAEAALRRSEERLDSVVTGTRSAIWDTNLLTGELWWSPQFAALLGYREDEFPPTDESWQAHLHPDDRRPVLAEIGRYLLGARGVYQASYRLRRKDGTWLWVEARGGIQRSADGKAQRFLGIISDITDRKLMEERVRTAERRLAHAIESIDEAFCLWDESDRLALCNAKFRTLYPDMAARIVPGVAFEDLVGALISCEQPLLEGPDRQAWEVLRRQIHRDGGTMEIPLADGRWVLASERRTADGCLVALRTDITALKLREMTLAAANRRIESHAADLAILAAHLDEAPGRAEEARAAADEANRAKSNFLATMSHELRTPLNAILGFSEIIRDRIFGSAAMDRYAEYAGDIHDSGQHLLNLISDILDISKIEAGKLTIEPVPLDLPSLLEGSLRLVMVRAAEAGLSLHLALAEPLAPLVADERAVKQIIFNLLSNALKFTPRGGSITLSAVAESNGTIALSVADTGVGIPADQIGRVMKPFEQIDNRYSRGAGGTGLGLSLVKALTELHGGSITIASVVDKGTTVTVRLPSGPGVTASDRGPPARPVAP